MGIGMIRFENGDFLVICRFRCASRIQTHAIESEEGLVADVHITACFIPWCSSRFAFSSSSSSSMIKDHGGKVSCNIVKADEWPISRAIFHLNIVPQSTL
ncbi:hypothetical protein L249_7828 [Ophiocordyceps polyrhachis-furcata BCC 54312]|uniref:Uncharacterized protein n=1 Tax=Ophiocordyceps polyrhachis-furcata BCC 54312 TaxID=1330021 RepID=A0A367L0S0_9HYPO|nr:hypothetical protein L249_7828 [Ophiocordyceps polyrhachis-furcata BCC 54312]